MRRLTKIDDGPLIMISHTSASPILATPLSNLLAKQAANNVDRPRFAHVEIGLFGAFLSGKLDLAER